jgi:hypothetical protein
MPPFISVVETDSAAKDDGSELYLGGSCCFRMVSDRREAYNVNNKQMKIRITHTVQCDLHYISNLDRESEFVVVKAQLALHSATGEIEWQTILWALSLGAAEVPKSF